MPTSPLYHYRLPLLQPGSDEHRILQVLHENIEDAPQNTNLNYFESRFMRTATVATRLSVCHSCLHTLLSGGNKHIIAPSRRRVIYNKYPETLSTLLEVIIEKGTLNKSMTLVKQHFDP